MPQTLLRNLSLHSGGRSSTPHKFENRKEKRCSTSSFEVLTAPQSLQQKRVKKSGDEGLRFAHSRYPYRGFSNAYARFSINFLDTSFGSIKSNNRMQRSAYDMPMQLPSLKPSIPQCRVQRRIQEVILGGVIWDA